MNGIKGMIDKIDYVLQVIQLYSYLLPTVKIGNTIMDFRTKYTIKHTKRRKDLEYGWIFKYAFLVYKFYVSLENGKTYYVYAHDFNDTEYFISKLEIGCFSTRDGLGVKVDKYGEPLTKPFWWRGRVYEYTGYGNKVWHRFKEKSEEKINE
jgi:hypothetical protein